MSFNLSISDVPTHVVVWQDKDNMSVLVKSLTDRITSLEATVTSLLKKETPLLSGLDVRRGIPPLNIAQETDSRGLFKELIEMNGCKPQPLPGNIYEMTSDNIKFVDILPTIDLDGDAEDAEDAEEEDVEEAEDAEDAEMEVEVEKVDVQEDAEGTEEQDAEEQDVEGTEEEQQEEQEVEQEQDAEEEEQALELTEFEYKGVTYFRDPENQVYQVDTDGDLDDTPIGLWSEEKQKVLRFRSA
jgi:hypothetical protein